MGWMSTHLSSLYAAGPQLKASGQTDICIAMFIAALFTAVKGGNNPNVYQQMNIQTKRDIAIQWNIIQSSKGTEF